MDYSYQKKYFETAYATGSDVWTEARIGDNYEKLLTELPAHATILDLGSGRGRLPFMLAREGFKVIGLDYVKQLVDKNNEEVKNHKLGANLRFVEGDIFDIPFADTSFDAVLDLGLMQHMHPEDWSECRAEIVRVLRPGGHYFIVALSKDTPTFLNWLPKNAAFGDFEKEGVFYHFFTKEELHTLFENDFEIVSEQVETVTQHSDKVLYHNLLLKKK